MVVVGAGPAGLTTALELSNHSVPCTVLERDDVVGGIARTVEHRGFRFDLGGHRFFSKLPLINRIWHELLGDELVVRPRLSRIHYRGKWFQYPLRPLDALRGLGAIDAARVISSYGWAKLRPLHPEASFEQWVTNRFGRRLFETFFQSYTEKVWGLSTAELSADWAAQRIQNLSLGRAIRHAVLGEGGGELTKTLIGEFLYPRLGPGQLWERCRTVVCERGAVVEPRAGVRRILLEGRRAVAITIARAHGEDELALGELVSTMPLADLIAAFEPAAPSEVREAARRLRHRGMVVANLMVDAPTLFPDNWIYVHTPGVRVGRIQNFKNWSPHMVPDPAKTGLGLEYFLWPDEAAWGRSDEEWIALATREAAQLGLIDPSQVEDGYVARVPDAYPVYGPGYREDVACVRAWLETLENVQTVGRSGLHRYNNQDHSMMTGIYAARNILGESNDVWSVNVEEDYLEEARGRDAPCLGAVPSGTVLADETAPAPG